MAPKQKVIVEDDAIYIMQPGMRVFLKTADVCAMTGTSNQWIGQLNSQGTINKAKTPHGSLFELVPTVKGYCQMLEDRYSPVDEENAKLLKARNTADVQLKAAKAARARLELEEIKGQMHRSEDVAAITEDLVYTIRGALVALPGRLAIDAAAAQTPAEASEVIRREVHKIMRELANYHYDPKKYEERVRERMDWSERGDDED